MFHVKHLYIFVISVLFYTNMAKTEQVKTVFDNEKIEKDLKNHVKTVSDKIGERNVFNGKLILAEEYIEKEISKCGYEIEKQTYLPEELGKRAPECSNIIVTKTGMKDKDKIILIGAHYDSMYQSPGADDNASSVACLLVLADIISKLQFEKTIKLIFFTNEEPPFYKTNSMGSVIYAKRARKNKENIIAMICLEMVGYFAQGKNTQKYPPLINLFYPKKGNFIAIVGNLKSHSLVKLTKKAFNKYSEIPVETISIPGFIAHGVDFSDHSSFWNEGYKAVMITDTSFYRNRNYHTREDIYNTLDYKEMTKIVKGLNGLLMESDFWK